VLTVFRAVSSDSLRQTVFVILWRQEQSITSTYKETFPSEAIKTTVNFTGNAFSYLFAFACIFQKEIIYSGIIQVGKNPFSSFILYCVLFYTVFYSILCFILSVLDIVWLVRSSWRGLNWYLCRMSSLCRIMSSSKHSPANAFNMRPSSHQRSDARSHP